VVYPGTPVYTYYDPGNGADYDPGNAYGGGGQGRLLYLDTNCRWSLGLELAGVPVGTGIAAGPKTTATFCDKNGGTPKFLPVGCVLVCLLGGAVLSCVLAWTQCCPRACAR